MASNKATGGVVNLTAEALEQFSGLVQAALAVLYGCGVALDADKEFGSVAGTLEGVKDVANDRARKMRAEAAPKGCPKCKSGKPSDKAEAKGLCPSCWFTAAEAAAPQGKANAPKAKPAAAVAETVKVDAPKPAVVALPTSYKGLLEECKRLGLETCGTEDIVKQRLAKHLAADSKPAVPAPQTVKPAPVAQTAKQDKPAAAPKQDSKPAPVAPVVQAKPPAIPQTWQGLTALGAEDVNAIAKQLNVSTQGKTFAKIRGEVWSAIKTSKPPAAPKPTAPQTARPTQYAAGTILVADGKGGVRPASEADLWHALEQLSKAAA